MFLFITTRFTPVSGFENLNTSHVLIYLTLVSNSWDSSSDLNTSHVLIYHISD